MLKNVEFKKVVTENSEIKNYFKSFNSEMSNVKKALKSVQSQKCNWNKKKSHPNYEKSMNVVLIEEQSLKNIIQFYTETKIKSFEMSENDIKCLNELETTKMIKNIQSQKCLKRYNDDQTDFEKCLVVEKMLFEHKKTVETIDDNLVKKSSIQQLINDIQNKKSLNKVETIKLLQELL